MAPTIIQLTDENIHGMCDVYAGRQIAPNTGANATKFFTLATKS